MKILLTGATGFIGSAFLNLAASRGHEIAALVRPGVKPRSNHAEYLPGTLAAAPWPGIESFAPDLCVHTAWITTPGVYLESPENEAHLNWSLEFLNQLRARGLRRAIVLGTCIEYESSNEPLSESSTPIRPTTYYARCKDQLRQSLESTFRAGNASLCWARVFYPYGPGEASARLVSSLVRKMSANEPITLKTPNSARDYIFIDDLADALLQVAESTLDGPINLGTGTGVTVREIAESVAAQLGKPGLPRISDPAPPPDVIVADATRLQSLGWRQKTTLEEGIARQIRHLGF